MLREVVHLLLLLRGWLFCRCSLTGAVEGPTRFVVLAKFTGLLGGVVVVVVVVGGRGVVSCLHPSLTDTYTCVHLVHFLNHIHGGVLL